MLPRNASHFRKSPKLSHVAHVERIAFPERALLELWLQIRNMPCCKYKGMWQRTSKTSWDRVFVPRQFDENVIISKFSLNDTCERLYLRTRVLQINHKHVYRKEFPKAFASIYSATHPSSIASITYRLGEITAEECDQFGRLSLLTRLTYECYCHAHSRKGYFRVLRQVFDHFDFLIECLSSDAGKIVAHVLVSHA
jgi:hypothetical protein